MKTINPSSITYNDSRIINIHYQNELKKLYSDLESLDKRSNTFLGIQARDYLPIVGPHISFIVYALRFEMDIITILLWLIVMYFTIYFIKSNQDWLYGEHGQIKYTALLQEKMEVARNETMGIGEKDYRSQLNWLLKYPKGGGLEMSKEYDDKNYKLCEDIRNCKRQILLFLTIAFTNCILNTLPLMTPCMRVDANKIGRIFELLPEWIKWLYLLFFSPSTTNDYYVFYKMCV